MRIARALFLLACLLACFSMAQSSTSSNSEKIAAMLAELGVTPDQISKEMHAMKEWIVGYRRKLHAIPELMYDLSETSAIVRGALDEIGVPYKYPVAKQGIVGTIGTGQSPVVALRSDMDALPVLEPHDEDTKAFASRYSGKMHACGHDGHMSMLLGAAKLLKQREMLLKGTVRLVFQPAEEGGAGGLMMQQEGVLNDPPVQHMFGLHVWPWMPTGQVGAKAGPIFAAAGQFEITISGTGGHAAAGIGIGVVDPIVAASAIVTSLQTIVSRDISPIQEGVVSVTMMHAGHAFNVVPDHVVVGGTIRAFSKDLFMRMEKRAREIAEYTAKAHGCNVSAIFTSFDDDCFDIQGLPAYFPSGCTYPPVVNDAKTWNMAKGVAAEFLGRDNVKEVSPTMGGEDFAYFAERVPSAFVLVGIANETKQTTAGLHSPLFKLDEDALPIGAALHVNLALHTLGQLGGLKMPTAEL